jgi:hypothetical protein
MIAQYSPRTPELGGRRDSRPRFPLPGGARGAKVPFQFKGLPWRNSELSEMLVQSRKSAPLAFISFRRPWYCQHKVSLHQLLYVPIPMEFSLSFPRSFPYHFPKTISSQREVNSAKRQKHGDQKLLKSFAASTQIWLRIFISIIMKRLASGSKVNMRILQYSILKREGWKLI